MPKVNDSATVLPPIGETLPIDGGPRYTETQDLNARIVEPFNTVTAAFFVLIALYWAWRVRHDFRTRPFLTCCLPILLAGGIGGTLYHATRSLRLYFLLDVIPITLLAVAVSMYLFVRLKPRGEYVLVLIGVYVVGQAISFHFLSRHLAITISYVTMSSVIILPILLILLRTNFRYIGWIAASLTAFVLAVVCRFLDVQSPLSMGTHWLWHTFGAISTLTLSQYIYLIEGRSLEELRVERPAEQ